jgi:uncharacterized protein YcfL
MLSMVTNAWEAKMGKLILLFLSLFATLTLIGCSRQASSSNLNNQKIVIKYSSIIYAVQ